MTNIFVKNGVVVHATNDDVELPVPPAMIEFVPVGRSDMIRVGAGDVNVYNSTQYNNVTLPEDYKDGIYNYNGVTWIKLN